MHRLRFCRWWFTVLTVALCTHGDYAVAEQASLTAVKDNTLYQYDPTDPATSLNSNGHGDFFSSGRSLNRSQIRRGLIQFDFSSLPAGAQVVPGSLQLAVYVVDVPQRDPSPRPFWLVAAEEGWGEGDSAVQAGVSGSGSGAAAEAGDATWFHTSYDPSIHDTITFTPGGEGFWPAQGAISADPLDPSSLFGAPVGVVPSEIGAFTFQGKTLELHVNGWLTGQANNGWIVLGDETLATDAESSLRGFATHEHANPEFRPTLNFSYTVPEPTSGWLLGIAIGLLVAARSRMGGLSGSRLNDDESKDNAGNFSPKGYEPDHQVT